MRLAFLTNILTPYRMHFFDLVHENLKAAGGELAVFVMTERLPLRPWNYQELKREYSILLEGHRYDIGSNDYLWNPKATKTILDFKPDALVVAGSWTYPTTWKVLFSRKIQKQCKTFFWTESHDHTGLPNASKTNKFVSFIKKKIYERFDGYCVPGKYAIETLSKYVNIANKAIVHLPNMVDNQYYEIANLLREKKRELRKEKHIPEDCLLFFTPARMVDLKGQIPFFTNVAEAVQGANVCFILAGEGPDKEAIQQLAAKKRLNIQILDYQTQEQIREWEAIADAFLLPSLSDPNPLTNIEAAWAGLPLCISCYVGNGPELVEDGVNGVVFDTLSKRSVSVKIKYLLDQQKEWFMSAGKRSLEKAREAFNSEEEVKRWIKEIDKVCG